MTVLPVIERELRAEARNSYHHWMRLTSASAVLVYFYLIARDYEGPAPWLGRRLFQALAQSSVLMTLVVTPLLTADCLSREKREGTLGLLFLTPPVRRRGNSQIRPSQLPKRLDTQTDRERFTLSHPTQAAPEASPRRVGEGRGEGASASSSEVVYSHDLT